jgi:RNA polymerase sigma factor (sigma-70 family)
MVMDERALTDGAVFARSVSEPQLFTLIFDRHYRAVYGYVSRRAGRAIADDIAAETFTRAFERRSSFDCKATRALPWLLGIAVNLLAHHCRSEGRQFRALAPARPRADAASEGIDAALAERLVVGLEQLDEDDREALLLYAWGELKYEEIAAALAIPLGTVQSRLHRARRKLRAALEAEGEVVRLPSRAAGRS